MNAFPKFRSSGFSLVEIMIGVVIMALMLAVAVPDLQAWYLNTQIRNAAESVQNGLQYARGQAIARNTNVVFTLEAAQTTWNVSVPSLPAANQIIERRLSSEGSPDVIRAVTPGGATMVTFGNDGLPGTNANGSATITSIALDLPTTILPAAQSKPLNVTIGFSGSVKMCDPHVTAPNPRACN